MGWPVSQDLMTTAIPSRGCWESHGAEGGQLMLPGLSEQLTVDSFQGNKMMMHSCFLGKEVTKVLAGRGMKLCTHQVTQSCSMWECPSIKANRTKRGPLIPHRDMLRQ